MTLVEFLLAQIAEDEEDLEEEDVSGHCDYLVGRHYDNERVRAECEAKRRIVNRHRNCGTGYGYCDDGGHGWDDEDGPGCGDLADLASVYADRPGYDPAWRTA
ncbi:DUF6221 family protein [Nocardioides sp. LML1-1-1.1]|uniref:DUF6221 family protein n=1 Tax=Nocardioides sp. LML1-1-1.1 TaxID=3135248 RepID=UPI0034486435